jgi:integrase
MFAWAVQRKIVCDNPVTQTRKLPESRRKDIRIPTIAEIKAVILAAPVQFKQQWTLQMMLGARPGEIDGLKWDDVFLSAGIVRLWTRKTSGGHERGRTVALNKTAHDILSALQAKRGERKRPYVFPNPKTGEPYKDRHTFRLACVDAGVEPFHRHALRHFAASTLLERGIVGIKDLQELLGHTNAATTELYIHQLQRSIDHKRGITEALDGVLEDKKEGTVHVTSTPKEKADQS